MREFDCQKHSRQNVLRYNPHISKLIKIICVFMDLTHKYFLSCSLLVVITALTFSPCLWNKITNWDDQFMLTKNEQVRDLSWPGVQKIFTSFTNGSYVPLTVFSYALEYKFSQLEPNAYHTTNLALHLLNVLLVFWLLNLITGQPLVSFITALLFAVNPLRVESVAWISARKDLLYSFFFLGSLISYIRHLQSNRKSTPLHTVSFLLFVLSVLAKPQAMILPVVLISLDFLFAPKTWKSHLASKIPFFGVAMVSLLIGQGSLSPYLSEQNFSNIFSIADKFFLTTYSIFFYIGQTLSPTHITALYPYPLKINGLFPWGVYLSPLLIFAATFFLLKKFSNDKKLLWGTLFFITTLLFPLMNIWLGGYFASDRYMYLPSIGLFLALTHSAFEYGKSRLGTFRKWNIILISLYIVFICTLSISKCFVWKNDITIWSDVLDLFPDTAIAYNNRGSKYMEIGELRLALDDLNQAVRLNPKYKDAYFNRALLFTQTRQYERAISDLSIIIGLDSRHLESYNNRGFLHFSENKLTEAIYDFTQALKIDPNYIQARLNRAQCSIRQQNYRNAYEDITVILKEHPDHQAAIGMQQIIEQYTQTH